MTNEKSEIMWLSIDLTENQDKLSSIQIDKYLKQCNQYNDNKGECGNARWLSATVPTILAVK